MVWCDPHQRGECHRDNRHSYPGTRVYARLTILAPRYTWELHGYFWRNPLEHANHSRAFHSRQRPRASLYWWRTWGMDIPLSNFEENKLLGSPSNMKILWNKWISSSSRLDKDRQARYENSSWRPKWPCKALHTIPLNSDPPTRPGSLKNLAVREGQSTPFAGQIKVTRRRPRVQPEVALTAQVQAMPPSRGGAKLYHTRRHLLFSRSLLPRQLTMKKVILNEWVEVALPKEVLSSEDADSPRFDEGQTTGDINAMLRMSKITFKSPEKPAQNYLSWWACCEGRNLSLDFQSG